MKNIWILFFIANLLTINLLYAQKNKPNKNVELQDAAQLLPKALKKQITAQLEQKYVFGRMSIRLQILEDEPIAMQALEAAWEEWAPSDTNAVLLQWSPERSEGGARFGTAFQANELKGFVYQFYCNSDSGLCDTVILQVLDEVTNFISQLTFFAQEDPIALENFLEQGIQNEYGRLVFGEEKDRLLRRRPSMPPPGVIDSPRIWEGRYPKWLLWLLPLPIFLWWFRRKQAKKAD